MGNTVPLFRQVKHIWWPQHEDTFEIAANYLASAIEDNCGVENLFATLLSDRSHDVHMILARNACNALDNWAVNGLAPVDPYRLACPCFCAVFGQHSKIRTQLAGFG